MYHGGIAMQYKLRGHQGERRAKLVFECAGDQERRCFIFKISKEVKLEHGDVGVAPLIYWPIISLWICPLQKHMMIT